MKRTAQRLARVAQLRQAQLDAGIAGLQRDSNELARAQQEQARKHEAIRASQQELQAAEARRGAIQPGLRLLATSWLAAQQASLDELALQCRQSAQAVAVAKASVLASWQASRVLDLHRARLARRQAAHGQRLLQIQADEYWLQTRDARPKEDGSHET